MFFEVFKVYCKEKKDSNPWDVLFMTESNWYKCRRSNRLCKNKRMMLYRIVGMEPKDDSMDELSHMVYRAYYKET